ncbi:hypothetical protein FNF27_01182 [Cafeteria roenbergensis]|uniref:Aldoketomutase n=1 Tax=Cafeteria roenbergensis TaxID=33653 RepID=A0A5A8C274_CAFRO|nr:hypothetical protein FNF28_07599 [Cafeteria roenbergensis]KAA0153270.1 hypothetical protein FNF31_06514 [Cafeteria roenbergensis]KAA0177404.1 hypothetical protein FNF27_01182 [Cafeteria roenbergensis]
MAAAASTDASAKMQVAVDPKNMSFNRTGLRIKDPAASVPFYEDKFGFTLVHVAKQEGRASYFLGTLEDELIAKLPTDRESADAAKFVASYTGTLIELMHTEGTEKDDAFSVNNGNVEPHRGFGHLAVAVPDVYAFCEELEGKAVKFQKKPDEGRMKGLAFALDPDGYWIEVISRSVPELPGLGSRPSFAQTMLRVADIKESLAFFQSKFGMTLLDERHFGPGQGDFSLYFLASLPAGTELPAVDNPASKGWMTGRNLCILELTYNHGSEKDPAFKYHNGNDAPQGFSHIGFTVPADAAPGTTVTTPRDGYSVVLAERA